MYFSKLFVKTLKETPAEAELASHRFMLRAGLIRKLSAGIYSFLPLGYRTIRKIENIIREEMDRSGAQEVLLPALIPAELWRETGRWEQYGQELLRIKDRHNRDFCIGPTHEEVITDLVRSQVKSYRDLPVNLYQIQTKVRDEIRPRFGLMRCREFIMKDAYSFDRDDEGAQRTYQSMVETYERIFKRCGLEFCTVDADAGAIGGSFSHEFMVMAKSGEDAVVSCGNCSYAANMEKAVSKIKVKIPSLKNEDDFIPEKALPKTLVETPGKKTVEEVTAFLNLPPEKLIKTIIFKCGSLKDGQEYPVAALIRGDQEINETKLKNLLNVDSLELANEFVITEITGASPGFAGPVGLKKTKIIMDISVLNLRNAVVGANKNDHHYINIDFERDFKADLTGDFRTVNKGDLCSLCDGQLSIERGIEVGHVFKLGTKYSSAMKATFLSEEGKSKEIVMGCYGIGVGRTMAASIEQNHDENGIIWPVAIAPYEVLVLPVNRKDKTLFALAENIYDELAKSGIDVIIDDRDERPGVKFKDADLIGFPICIVIGKKTLEKECVEVKIRRTKETLLIPHKNKNVCKEILSILEMEKQ